MILRWLYISLYRVYLLSRSPYCVDILKRATDPSDCVGLKNRKTTCNMYNSAAMNAIAFEVRGRSRVHFKNHRTENRKIIWIFSAKLFEQYVDFV